MGKGKTSQVRHTVSFSNIEEKNFLIKAVKKINETAGNGVDLKLTAFMKNAALEKAREVLKEK